MGDDLPILLCFKPTYGLKTQKYGQEESLGCNEARFRLTDGWGNPRDSATERRLPFLKGKGETVG